MKHFKATKAALFTSGASSLVHRRITESLCGYCGGVGCIWCNNNKVGA